MRYPKRGIKRNAHPNGGPKQDDGAHDTTSGDVSRNQNKRQQKFRYASTDQINAMSELVMNTLR